MAARTRPTVRIPSRRTWEGMAAHSCRSYSQACQTGRSESLAFRGIMRLMPSRSRIASTASDGSTQTDPSAWAVSPHRARRIRTDPHRTNEDATMNALDELDAQSLRSDIPRFRAGDTVKVHVRVIEGSRSRVQVFQGVVIRSHGDGIREMPGGGRPLNFRYAVRSEGAVGPSTAEFVSGWLKQIGIATTQKVYDDSRLTGGGADGLVGAVAREPVGVVDDAVVGQQRSELGDQRPFPRPCLRHGTDPNPAPPTPSLCPPPPSLIME